MRRPTYPFIAIVGQHEMKLALTLAAIDWRIGVLLRGDKGSGKTTTARGLAALLPSPAPFINLPIGITEDRLIGGLHLEQAIKGDLVLKPGLLSEAHGGVLYIDEVNLLPPHIGDLLLDTAASGINVVEREGLSASHAAEFVLLGSMNPEEGSLRPQLLDRFALCVTVSAPSDAAERGKAVERRMAFERDPEQFIQHWSVEEQQLQIAIAQARTALKQIQYDPAIIKYISDRVCECSISSLRADLAVVRAAGAYAALEGDSFVDRRHVEAVLPFALAHRTRDARRLPTPPSPPPATKPSNGDKAEEAPSDDTDGASERIFPPRSISTPPVRLTNDRTRESGSASHTHIQSGPIIGTRPSDTPRELDVRASLTHAVKTTGTIELRTDSLHERIRKPVSATRYLFVVDSSGSHAVRERMRLVKGAAINLLERSFKRGDEIVLVAFRGTSAEVILEPTLNLEEAKAALEYIPTGGRTPLAHGLAKAASYATAKTLAIVVTDGRANYPLYGDDPWQDALMTASELACPALVIDTNSSKYSLDNASMLADALKAPCIPIDDLEAISEHTLTIAQRL